MELDIKAAAALMAVPEKTVYRWIREQGLPAHRQDQHYRLNRVELLEWATAQGIRVSPAIFQAPAAAGTAPDGLAAAIEAGGIHYDVPGGDKRAALESSLRCVPLPPDMDRDLLLDVILARESLGSTGVGDGIAIPHVRNPIVMHIPQPLVTLCFLATPVEFAAVDGKPVHTLFTLVCPAIKAHLRLLSRLSFGLGHAPFADAVRRRAPRDEILAAAAAADASAAPSAAGQGTGP